MYPTSRFVQLTMETLEHSKDTPGWKPGFHKQRPFCSWLACKRSPYASLHYSCRDVYFYFLLSKLRFCSLPPIFILATLNPLSIVRVACMTLNTYKILVCYRLPDLNANYSQRVLNYPVFHSILKQKLL